MSFCPWILLTAALCMPLAAMAQDLPGVADAAPPAGVKLEGEVVKSLSFSDKNGLNHFVLTRTPDRVVQRGEGQTRSAWLYGHHFVTGGDGKVRELRKITDHVEGCELDMTVRHLPEALRFTDLDGDGQAEITMLYMLACRGDVSGPELKLMLLENGEKHPIRGRASVVMPSGEVVDPGERNIGNEFKKAPPPFLDHALALWKQFGQVKL